jgi:hypothetical protein
VERAKPTAEIMLGMQPPTKLKRRGSWIIRRSKEEGETVRKRDKEDEKLFLKLKRDNANCVDCSAKGMLPLPLSIS